MTDGPSMGPGWTRPDGGAGVARPPGGFGARPPLAGDPVATGRDAGSRGASRQRHRGRRVVAALLGLLGLGVLSGAAVFRHLGYWLVVSDPLTPARAVVVLAGDFPFRAIEAAAVYRDGWAPEVWLQPSHTPARAAALARLGFRPEGEETNNERILLRLGVPGGAIRILDGRAQNTVEEVLLVARAVRESGGREVIVVTSKAHTRRVRSTWGALVREAPRLIVRFAREDPFEPATWWRDTRDALAVSREAFGLLNVWAGFPVQPPPSSAVP